MKRVAAGLFTFCMCAGLAGAQSKELSRVDEAELRVHQSARGKVGVAVVIGIKNYQRVNGFSQLQYSLRDADAVREALREQGYLVLTMPEQDATTESIRQLLAEAGDALDANMTKFLFYFSGHGYEHGGKNYVATWDTNWKLRPGSGLSLDEVEAIMKKTTARNRILLVDACRESVQGKAGLEDLPGYKRFLSSDGTKILLGAKLDRRSYEVEKLEHGIFTYFLLKGLRGEAADEKGWITFHNLALYVTDAVRDYSLNELGRVQVPYEAGEARGEILVGIKAKTETAAVAVATRPLATAERLNAAEEAWQRIRNTQNPELLEEFAQSFPESRLARTAKLAAAELRAGSPVASSVGASRVDATGRTAGEVSMGPDGLRYRWIPPGEFLMGCSPGDTDCDNDEKPARQVRMVKGYWLGETEVTQEAYELVTGKNPSRFKGSSLPVEMVNWHEAKEYCERQGMRLPSAEEWEYAARAGSTEARYGLVEWLGWYGVNDGKKTQSVGGKKANAWGLHDMLGNVWEWTATKYNDEAYELRGGSWGHDPRSLRASHRFRSVPASRGSGVGFRCLRD